MQLGDARAIDAALGVDAAGARTLGQGSLYPPHTRLGLDPTKRDEFANRISALRRAHAAQADTARASSLQILHLDQIRARFGRRWSQVRGKALSIVETSLQRELGRDDAYVAVSEVTYYIFRLGLKRRDADRRGALLAADMTERLCGALPGGVAVQLKTAAFDVDQGLAGIVSYEQLRNRIEAFTKSIDDQEARLFVENLWRLQTWFQPTLNVRKGLISAY
jgi:hypothetical protein